MLGSLFGTSQTANQEAITTLNQRVDALKQLAGEVDTKLTDPAYATPDRQAKLQGARSDIQNALHTLEQERSIRSEMAPLFDPPPNKAGLKQSEASLKALHSADGKFYHFGCKVADPCIKCLVSKIDTINPCVKAKAERVKLVEDVSGLTKRLIGQDIVTSGKQAGDFGPKLLPGDWTPCQIRAANMGETVRRYNKYTSALPAARAANDVNQLKDEDGSKAKPPKCLTRLPDNAKDLNRALGLKGNPINDGDLRNDGTGFRAAIYRDETTGRLIVVPRDTEKNTLVDWKTNIDNGQAKETDQYAAMRRLTGTLSKAGVHYDLSGYSKGGGLAQEGGLMSPPDSKVYVFNSAGLSDASLSRTGTSSFDRLASRTKAFSAEGDFLTYLNNTVDPDQQIANAHYLRDHLEGDGILDPIEITYRNPETKAAQEAKDNALMLVAQYGHAGIAPPPEVVAAATRDVDPTFQQDKQAFMKQLDQIIKDAESKRDAGGSFSLFPPVRSNDMETVPDSMGTLVRWAGADKPEANLARLNQHVMGSVLDPMEELAKKDRAAMERFLKACS